MPPNMLKKLLILSLEEKILSGASLLACICVFFPWIGGEWLGGRMIAYSGLGFFTSFIGIGILLLHAFILLPTAMALAGKKQLFRREFNEPARLAAAALASILTMAVWSVLTKFTFEFSRLQIHFGLYGTLIGSLVATLYAFLVLQESRKASLQGMFHLKKEPEPTAPPPPATEPEDYRIHP